jgi:hypothetical protein
MRGAELSSSATAEPRVIGLGVEGVGEVARGVRAK